MSSTSLWLPIIVAAGIVLLANLVIWMVPSPHKDDWPMRPDEEGRVDAMRKACVQKGRSGALVHGPPTDSLSMTVARSGSDGRRTRERTADDRLEGNS